MLLENLSLNGTVLSVTKATRRTESSSADTSITAVAMLSLGSKWRYGGKVPSNCLEVIDFKSVEKPTNLSFAVTGAIAKEMFLVEAIVFAASAKVRARNNAVVAKSGLFGFQLISLTARR